MAASEEKEGKNLLGSPTFKKLENGRFKCVQTGHELLDKDKETYSNSKQCRLGLIEFALSRNKAPLNMFKPDPSSRSKLICKLTGDTVNKSEEHLWKHINGRRFLNKLEEMETQNLTPDKMVELNEKKVEEEKAEKEKDDVKKKNKNKKKKKTKKKNEEKNKSVEETVSEVREPKGNDDDDDDENGSEEADFWVPPDGARWDFDDGGDRWGSDSESENEADDKIVGEVEDDDGKESEELSVRAKRMSIEIGPSSFASRKKKPKRNSEGCSDEAIV